ncbi:MAG TPA: NADH-quinone oxidoreductase subunit L [Candidatus Limnocylindrales bacterium]|nr:NADH-quinone oxidoreductase subunit L [Candidatus Limnocylindrales bacterium]
MTTIDDVSSWAVWILPLISCLFVPVIAKYGSKIRDYFVIAIATVTAGFAFSLIPGIFSGTGQATSISIPWISGIQAGVYVDPLSILFTALIGFFGLIILIYSLGYMKGEEGLTRYYFYMLLFIGSMIGLVISNNLLQMFIFWEMVGLCSYALVSFWYKRKESVNAGNKVFIMTRIGDASLLAAIGLLYAAPLVGGHAIASFNFSDIITSLTAGAKAGTLNTGLMIPIFFLVLGGAIAKSAQLPLFTWLYSAMEAPTSVSALLHAATMVKAGIYLLARFILIATVATPLILALQPLWFPTVAWIGVLTAFVGATLAITTTDIKGVLAYSTVSQIGFMMAALGAAVAGAATVGWFASLFHMVSHAFFEGLGFLLAGGIIHAIGTRDMRLMGGLRKAMPVSFALMLVMVITTSGLPPFAAFFSKGLVISSVTSVSVVQAIVLYATAAITFAYCIRMLSLVFMGKESERLQSQHVHEAPKVMLIPAALLAVLCVTWGLSMPLIGNFLHVNLSSLGVSLLNSFTDVETPIFLALLIPTGLLVYLAYYKNYMGIRSFGGGSNPIAIMLQHGYFFDDFYYAIVRGIIKFSDGLQFLEYSTTRVLDSFGDGIIHISSSLKKLPSTAQNYIAAAIIGLILIVVLIILTVGV